MSRQTTPNILDAALKAPPRFDLVGAMSAAPEVALYYDYDQFGADGASIREHAIAIKLANKRMAAATIDAGQHLMAVKASLPHGHWLMWLESECGLSDDAAERMMAVARRFGGNSATLRNLSPSVLALLAPKSVPDAAVDAVVAASADAPITVAATRTIIAEHKARGRCRICKRPLTDPAQVAAGIGPCCAARMVAQGGEAQPEPETAPAPETPVAYRVEAVLLGGGERSVIGVIQDLAPDVVAKLQDGRLRVQLVLVYAEEE